LRIRFGGTITGSTITGGTSVESQAIGLTNHSGYLGHPGRSGFNSRLLGTDGSYYRPKPTAPRVFTMSVAAWDRDSAGTITAPNGKCEELEDNQDTLLGLIEANGGQFMIERDMEDTTTRWIMAEVNGPAYFVEGPLFGEVHAAYTLLIPLLAAYPYWQSETLNTEAGGATLVNDGNGRISNSVITLGGSATLENDETGDVIENLDGSAIIVDVGARTVTQGGNPADALLDPATPEWMRFVGGTNNLTTSGSVSISYRDHFV
jgi:hypothetical protein